MMISGNPSVGPRHVRNRSSSSSSDGETILATASPVSSIPADLALHSSGAGAGVAILSSSPGSDASHLAVLSTSPRMASSPSSPTMLSMASPPTTPRHHRFPSLSEMQALHAQQPPQSPSHLTQVHEDQPLEKKDCMDDHEAAVAEIGWSRKTIWAWYDALPWLAGMNYLPRTAVNFVEMWDATTFNPEVIEQELRWAAEKLGYNTLRTNIPMVLYEHDAVGLTARINKFLRIAARTGFVVMMCLLDDCEFGGEAAKPGPQPDPIPGLHNSRAIGSPGRHITRDPSQWFRVEDYVRHMVRTWGQDPRILLWDLYNEPGNPWIFSVEGTRLVDDMDQYEQSACDLMEKVFAWARAESPVQPLTTSAWHMPDPFNESGIVPLAHFIDQRAMQLSDVVSIHAYCDPGVLQAVLQETAQHGKPILLTEWMARQVQSTYESALPTLRELKIGAYQWGLVKGKTQTHLPWPHVQHQYQGETMWWHDVLDAEGNFYSEKEGDFIRSYAYPQSKAFNADFVLSSSLSQSNTSLSNLAGQNNHDSFNQLNHSTHQRKPSFSLLTNELLLVNAADHPLVLNGDFDAAGDHIHGLHLHQSVMPSVCSINMATVNAAAAVAAAEMCDKGAVEGIDLIGASMRSRSNSLQIDGGDGDSRHRRVPTFNAQMSSLTVEGLDLVFGGIEF